MILRQPVLEKLYELRSTASTTAKNYRFEWSSGTIDRGPTRPLLLTVSPSRRSASTTGSFQSESVAAFAGMRMSRHFSETYRSLNITSPHKLALQAA